MTNRQPTDSKNLDQYGNPPLDWDQVRALLDAQSESDHPAWLGTVDPDGRPHAAGVGTVWFDGDMYFVSGPGTRKSRNIAGNPAVSIATSLKGMDVVLEGDASQVTDPDILEKLAERYRAEGWPVEVEGTSFIAPYTAPSGGPPPWNLYRLTAHTVYGVGGENAPQATRWSFAR
jgi:hypothetical protein